jgi:hypothetical protein
MATLLGRADEVIAVLQLLLGVFVASVVDIDGYVCASCSV